MNEEEQLEEMHCGGKRHDDLEAGMRCPMCGHVVMAEAEDKEEEKEDPYAMARHYQQRDSGRYGSKREGKEELEEAQEKEVVEETISNDEWYQNELFESLKKRWTK